jgi:hypothetical protein
MQMGSASKPVHNEGNVVTAHEDTMPVRWSVKG